MLLAENTRIIHAPIQPECFVCVVIPARDESAHIAETLAAFARQVDLKGKKIPSESFEITVLINNCSDNSAEIARKLQKENPQICLRVAECETAPENANSGFVRRLLMNEAFRRLTESGRKNGVIMTTDGDTRVADDWIAANLSEIESGADAVGGRILFTADELARMNPAARSFHLIDEEYRLLAAELEAILDPLPHDPAPRHHQHFNGSFAVTTEAFEKAGGVPDVRFLEDVAFFQALTRVDAKFRHSPIVKVYTSARSAGRTEAGLSTQISDWINLSERGENFLVESAASVEKRLRSQNILRRIWQNIQEKKLPEVSEMENLAAAFCVSFDKLSEEANKSQTFGVLLENIRRMRFENQLRNEQNPLAPVGEAVKELKKMIENPDTENRKNIAAA